jgi:transcription antitermination protein NusB
MPKRTHARELAFQILYQDDFNARVVPAIGDAMLEARLKREETVRFARQLISGVRLNRAKLDQAISESAKNWSLERMAATDRCALRLGAYEMLHFGTPAAVVIDETIELARRFGTAQSAKFVNGVLDQIRKAAEDGKISVDLDE